MNTSRGGRRRGAVAVWVAVCMFALVAVVALATDCGWMFGERRQSQAAADAAALAGAGELLQSGAIDRAQAAALALAAANGHSNDGSQSIVTVQIPPTAGLFAGQPGYVEVIVQRESPASFSSVFGYRNLIVRARATARGLQTGEAKGFYVLQPSRGHAFHINRSGSNLIITSAPLYVNDSDPKAVLVDAKTSVTAASFEFVGGYERPEQLMGPIHAGVMPTPDPLANIPAPNPGEYPVRSTEKVVVDKTPVTLEPGHYIDGIHVKGPGPLTLNPGIYVMNGGGFVVDTGTVTGLDVMIYNSAVAPRKPGVITIKKEASVTLRPPQTGVYAGISLFQGRTWDGKVVIEGNNNKNITGAVYAPAAEVELKGLDVASTTDVMAGMIVCYTTHVEGYVKVDSPGTRPREVKYGLVE
jgi:hypothetical protein